MPYFEVDIRLEHGEKGREVHIVTEAIDGRNALLLALAEVEIRKGELIHYLHCSVPIKTDPRRP